MPSKGIEVYSYISPEVQDVKINFSVPGTAESHQSGGSVENRVQVRHLEIESKAIPGEFNFSGKFAWNVQRGNSPDFLAGGYNFINSLSGNIEHGTMLSTVSGPSVFVEDLIITYGFYDAGSGVAGLTDRDQFWVSITVNHSSWMTELVVPGTESELEPFSRFVLCAPHDPGMNSLQNAQTVINGVDSTKAIEFAAHIPFVDELGKHVGTFALHNLLPHLVEALAVTQKDTISSMLALGARYFEFRPAYILNDLLADERAPLPNVLYFHHACIPGLMYDHFLADIVSFLDEHPNEIVTIHIRWDGIPSECRKPTPAELTDVMNTALGKSSTSLQVGNIDHLKAPIKTLRVSGTRLICLTEAQKYDSYTNEAYGTLSATSIIKQLATMNTAGQANNPITVLQCQATPQRLKDVVIYSVLASNAATSSLMETKPRMDQETLPWVEEHALKNLKAEESIILMNDFMDGRTTDLGIKMSAQRFAESGLSRGVEGLSVDG